MCEFSCATLLSYPPKNLCHPFAAKTTSWSCCAALSTSTLVYLVPEGHSPISYPVCMYSCSQRMSTDLKHQWVSCTVDLLMNKYLPKPRKAEHPLWITATCCTLVTTVKLIAGFSGWLSGQHFSAHSFQQLACVSV